MIPRALLGFVVAVLTQSSPVRVKTRQRRFAPTIISDEVFHAGAKVSVLKTPSIGPVTELPGYGRLSERSFAGYLDVNESCTSNLYFWLIESRSNPSTDPVLIWLNGGPGSSSFIGALTENGPYHLSNDGTIRRNPFSWNRRATYIMIDQPAGVGLSVVSHQACYAPNERISTSQLYAGLVMLLTRRLPQYGHLPLYIFGESYAGKYVPELATLALEHGGLNLAGIGLGDAWVDPKSLEQTYAAYAYSHGLLSISGKAEAERLQAQCGQAWSDIEKNASATPDDWRALDNTCNEIESYIVNVSGGVDVYDVRSFRSFDLDFLGKYLDRDDVRRALQVDPSVGPFEVSSDTVAYLLQAQEEKSSAHLLPRILSQIRVLVYNGVFDMDCNFMGTDAWLSGLGDGWWPGSSAYKLAERVVWKPDKTLECVGQMCEGGDGAGVIRGHGLELGNLTQLLVLGAGHLVPKDQPESAAIMLESFLSGHSFFGSGKSPSPAVVV